MLECHLQRITKKGHQHVGLHPLFQLMEQGRMASSLFRVRNAASLRSTACTSSRDLQHHLLSDSCAADRLPLALRAIAVAPASAPDQTRPFFVILHRHLIEIRHLRMRSLNAAQAHKHFVASFSLPSTMRFSSPVSAFFDLTTKRLRMAFSFSFLPAVRHKM